MKKWFVCGIRRIDIDKEGNVLHGYTLHFQREDENVTGLEVCSYFLRDGKCEYEPSLGDEVYLIFNRNSKLDGVLPVF